MPITVITAPTFEPVTLAEAKAHLRVSHTAEDSLITALITVAREQAESYTQRSICAQTLDYSRDAFLLQFELPLCPLQSVTSIKYIDLNGTEQTLAEAEYQVNSQSIPAIIALAHGKVWPCVRSELNAVRIRYSAGYATAADIPASIKSAMLLLIGDLYENRENSAPAAQIELPWGFKALLNPYRIIRF